MAKEKNVTIIGKYIKRIMCIISDGKKGPDVGFMIANKRSKNTNKSVERAMVKNTFTGFVLIRLNMTASKKITAIMQ